MWLDLPFKQASLVSELKSWCLSKLQNMEVRFTVNPGSPRLQRFSSVAEGLNEVDVAGLTVLPSGQESSSQCLDLHHSPAFLESTRGEPSVAEDGSANHYFVVHMESSPGNTSTNCLHSRFCKSKHGFSRYIQTEGFLPLELVDARNMSWSLRHHIDTCPLNVVAIASRPCPLSWNQTNIPSPTVYLKGAGFIR